jgi:hypothetical protein
MGEAVSSGRRGGAAEATSLCARYAVRRSANRAIFDAAAAVVEHALALGAATRPGSTRGRDVARGARLARAPWETLCMSRISSPVRAPVCVLRGM